MVPVDRVIPRTFGLVVDNRLVAVAMLGLSLGVVAAFWAVYWLGTPGGDARVYYEADLSSYASSRIGTHSLMYPPPFVFWTAPLRLLPFEVFFGIILAAEMVSLVYMLGPQWAALALLVPLPRLHSELGAANLNLVVGALVVLALTRPSMWGPLALTKVTPAIGGLWHLFRGDWRAVGVAVGTTALLILPTLVWSQAWLDWASIMVESFGVARERTAVPMVARLPIAVGMLWWAARHDSAWMVPIAVVVALPVTWEGTLIALGAVRLARRR